MVSALINLQVCAAGQRHLHFDQHFPIADTRDRDFLDLYIFFAVKDGRRHLAVHSELPPHELPG